MKKLQMTFGFALLLLFAASSVMAAPTLSVYFSDEAEIDVAGATNSYVARQFVPFKVWVVMSNINDTANGVEYKLNMPPAVAFTSIAYFGAHPIDVGAGSGDGAFLGFGECATVYDALPGQGELTVAVYTAISVSNVVAPFSVTLSEFEGGAEGPLQSTPRYSNCQGVLTNLTSVGGTFEVAVANYSKSWSTVKSLFN